MKKSDMLQLMRDHVRGYTHNWHTNSSNKEMYEQLLDKMVEAGMLPPDISRCNCEDCGGPCHDWDSE